jgi:hypothetical protein
MIDRHIPVIDEINGDRNNGDAVTRTRQGVVVETRPRVPKFAVTASWCSEKEGGEFGVRMSNY